jgi:hypothetical protein
LAKTKVDIRAFRHQVKILKDKGLIHNIDARSAQPYYVRQGKQLKDWIKEYDDVLSGKVEPVKLTPTKTKEYKRAGYEVKRGFTMVPKGATEKVKVTKEGEIEIKHPSGFKRIKYAVPFHNLSQWAKDMKKKWQELDKTKPAKAYWAYKFYGHNSYVPYSDLELLLDDLMNGSESGLNFTEKARHETHKQQNEDYQNLEFFIVPNYRAYPEPPNRRIKTTPAARKRYRQRIKNTAVGERARQRDAEAHRVWRAKLKGKKLAEYKKEGRKRAKKSKKQNKRKK